MVAVHYITWEQHADGREGQKLGHAAVRFRARYTQRLAAVVEQAQHDHEINGRHDVRVEDVKGKVVWEPE